MPHPINPARFTMVFCPRCEYERGVVETDRWGNRRLICVSCGHEEDLRPDPSQALEPTVDRRRIPPRPG